MSKYSDIIERLDKADGPSRELDARIWALIGWGDYAPDTLVNGRTMHEAIEKFPQDMTGIARAWEVDRFTASLDAAIALVERLLPEGNCHGYEKSPVSVEAYVSRNNVDSGHWYQGGEHKTSPAIALLIALFRALDAQEPA